VTQAVAHERDRLLGRHLAEGHASGTPPIRVGDGEREEIESAVGSAGEQQRAVEACGGAQELGLDRRAGGKGIPLGGDGDQGVGVDQ